MKVTIAAALIAAGTALLVAPAAHADPNNCSTYSHTPGGYTADLHRCGFASVAIRCLAHVCE
jgi:hypothetical protein